MATKAVAVPFPKPFGASPLVDNLRRLLVFFRRRIARAATAPERALAVEDRVTVGTKKSLLVVRCHGQRFLVGVSADAIGPFVEVGAAAGSPRGTRQAKVSAQPALRRRAHAERDS